MESDTNGNMESDYSWNQMKSFKASWSTWLGPPLLLDANTGGSEGSLKVLSV